MTTSRRSTPAPAAASTSSWRLADLVKPTDDAPRVFSTFAGGGGSCMGYALAGYRVQGACEIDEEMAGRYVANLGHKVYVEPIQTFRARDELPPECLDVDVLDGSPPCSTFSLATRLKRGESWGKMKHFREGQAAQVLDELFAEYLQLVARARPKVAVAENVVGMVVGKARGFAKEVLRAFRDIGYEPQLFRLNAALMGVPQSRERVFFLARRADLELPPIELDFSEPPIALQDALAGVDTSDAFWFTDSEYTKCWHEIQPGDKFSQSTTARVVQARNGSRVPPFYVWFRCHPRRPAPTLTAASPKITHWSEPRYFSSAEYARIQSFPDDYDFGDMKAAYVCGMSVPPRMMQRVAAEVRRQWLDHRAEADAA